MYEIHDENGGAYLGSGCEDCDIAILATENPEAICIECYIDESEPDQLRKSRSSSLV